VGVAAFMLAVSAGVVWAAAQIQCIGDNQPCTGTDGDDKIIGGPGNDRFNVGDVLDTVRCGKGKKEKVVDAVDVDQISEYCESVSRR
jgi:hypothetical protein